jgi:hypothetical protein
VRWRTFCAPQNGARELVLARGVFFLGLVSAVLTPCARFWEKTSGTSGLPAVTLLLEQH